MEEGRGENQGIGVSIRSFLCCFSGQCHAQELTLIAPYRKLLDMKGKKKRKVWVDRLVAVYDLATALEYLHSQKVMYRDLSKYLLVNLCQRSIIPFDLCY